MFCAAKETEIGMTEISSKDNPVVKEMAALCSRRRQRDEMQAYVCEGGKLFLEAVRTNTPIIKLLATREQYEAYFSCIQNVEKCGTKVYVCPPDLIRAASDTETPQGMVFTAGMAPIRADLPDIGSMLIADRIADPGNLGTMIRTADAFGIGTIFLTDGSADAYAPKTVRSAMGSLFRTRLMTGTAEEACDICHAAGIKLIAAVLDRKAVPLSSYRLPERCAIIIGNEANGVSQKMAEAADEHLFVDMSGETESLNASVCAAVLMWEMQKIRHESKKAGEPRCLP